MTDISSLLVSAICGGLGGALFNIVWASWRAPRLRVEFGTNVEGCTVPDVPYKRGPFEGTRKYLRLKVKNGGLSTAHDVQVIIQGFEFSNYPPFAGEVLDVLWSSAPTPTIKTSIPSRTFRFADICAADDAADSEGLRTLCSRQPLSVAARKAKWRNLAQAQRFSQQRQDRDKTIRIQFNGSAASLQILP